MNEADTCRKYVLPQLIAADWDNDPHSFTEQKTFTDGRIVVTGSLTHRRRQKRADYLLRYTRDFMIAVVEAKAAYKSPADGLQQAKEYAEILGLKFAYSTNGYGIIEFDYLTGQERQTLQTQSLVGGEAKSLPYLLTQMNLLLQAWNRRTSTPVTACASRSKRLATRTVWTVSSPTRLLAVRKSAASSAISPKTSKPQKRRCSFCSSSCAITFMASSSWRKA